MSKQQIYFEVRHVHGMMELYSCVMPEFGGINWEYVKSAPLKSTLVAWAEEQGWIEIKI